MFVLRQRAALYGYVTTLISYIRSLIIATFDYRNFFSKTGSVISD
jgi:hypothetical protein